jgi:hypothetical protein
VAEKNTDNNNISKEDTMKKPFKKTPPGFQRRVKRCKKTDKIERFIFSPNSYVRALHERVKEQFNNIVTFTTIEDCLKTILQYEFIVEVDIKDAFGSVDVTYARSLFEGVVQWSGEPAYFFHRENGLIQGANASPLLFELYCNLTIDKELVEYCAKRDIGYVRYVDNLFFLSHKPMPKSMRKVFRKIVRRHAFEPNVSKDQVVAIWKRKFHVLGTTMHRDGVRVTSDFYNRYLDFFIIVQDGETQYKRKVDGMKGWIRYVRKINDL